MADRSRGPGLSAFSRSQITSAQYASHGQSLRAAHADSLRTQLSVFRSVLHNFSVTHAKEIRSNPAFRAEFARMCNAIGVDPLASSNLGKDARGKSSGSGFGSLWAQAVGSSVNDFYFELGVRIVEVCRATRAQNGGLMSVVDAQRRVSKGRGVGGGIEVSEDDVVRAVESLAPLQSGFKLTTIGSKKMISSVSQELNNDQSIVLEAVQVLGYTTVSMLQLNLRWTRARASAIIEDLVASGLLWLDSQAEEKEYWSPSTIGQDISTV